MHGHQGIVFLSPYIPTVDCGALHGQTPNDTCEKGGIKSARAALFLLGKMKNEWNKWKNHFYEMKGDVGMSLHEKERNKMPTPPRHKATHNPIPTSLFLPRSQHTFSCVKMCCLLCLTNKQHVKANKDVGMGL